MENNKMIKLTVKDDFNRVALEYKGFGKNVDKAMISALNRTAAQGKTFADKTIRGTYNVKSADVKKNIYISKANPARSSSEIVATGKRFKLIKFNPKQTNKGISFKVRKDKKRSVLKHNFMQTMSSGHTGAYYRTGEFKVMSKGKYKDKRREIIKERYSLGVPNMFAAQSIMNKTKFFVHEKFPIVFAQRLEFYTKIKGTS